MKNKSGETAHQNSNARIGREVVVQGSGKKSRRPYRKDPTIPRKVVEHLANLMCAEHVAEILDISPSQVHRYKEIAIRLGILVDYCGQNPRLYSQGPRYELRKERGWWCKKFEPIECRIHRGLGSPYVYRVEQYEHFERLPIHKEDGNIEYRPFFNHCICHGHGYNDYRFRLEIPEEILGYEGTAKLDARRKTNGDLTLHVTVPELRWTYAELEALGDCDPFYSVLCYIEYFLEKYAKWSLEDRTINSTIQYAVSLKVVQDLCPELLQGVHKLKRGDKKENMVLFTDRSTTEGELETNHLGVIRDILAILEVERRKANGSSIQGGST